MGALRKLMPITAGTFIVGWLAIAGVPPFSGFWSKDEILTYALHKNIALYVVGLFTALLTAFYMSREVYPRLLRRGSAGTRSASEPSHAEAHGDGRRRAADRHRRRRGDRSPTGPGAPHDAEHGTPQAPPRVAVDHDRAAGGAGHLRRRRPGSSTCRSASTHWLENWLEPVTGRYGAVRRPTPTPRSSVLLAISHRRGAGRHRRGLPRLPVRQAPAAEQVGSSPTFLLNGWYYDWAVSAFMGGPGRIAVRRPGLVRPHVIDGAVNGVGALARDSPAASCAALQTGYVRTYALGITIGAVAARHLRPLPGDLLMTAAMLASELRRGHWLPRAGRHGRAARWSARWSWRSSPSDADPTCTGLVAIVTSRSRSPAAARPCGCSTPFNDGTTPGFQFVVSHDLGASSWTSSSTSASTASRCSCVVLTGILFPIALFAAKPDHDEKGYYVWITLLEAGCLGVFVALDLFLFFVMFELVHRAAVLPHRAAGATAGGSTRPPSSSSSRCPARPSCSWRSSASPCSPTPATAAGTQLRPAKVVDEPRRLSRPRPAGCSSASPSPSR